MRKSWRIEVALALCLVASFALSCGGPVVTAVGSSDDLTVIHGAGQKKIAERIEEVMQTPDAWLLDEPLFKPTLAIPSESGDLKNIRQVLLIGTWDDREMARLARRAFPSLEEDEPPALRTRNDVWAKGQLVGVIMGGTEEDVLAFLQGRGVEIAREFAADTVRRLARALEAEADKSGMTAALQERFGWSLAPPTGYDFFTTNAADRFVFFRRTRPDRTIFVYWQPGESGDVTDAYALSIREELANKYFDGDTTERKRPLTIETVDFLGRRAVRISGWWGNRTLGGGGTFRTYFFHEPTTGMLYMIDGTLFAPGFDKMPLMRNLDAIAHTFKVPGDPEGVH
jgi:hypothetical protein